MCQQGFQLLAKTQEKGAVLQELMKLLEFLEQTNFQHLLQLIHKTRVSGKYSLNFEEY